MKYETFLKELIVLVGGPENIDSVAHCVTRLRFQLKDRSKAQTAEIQEMKQVIDVIDNNVAYQVVVGTQVKDIYQELLPIVRPLFNFYQCLLQHRQLNVSKQVPI